MYKIPCHNCSSTHIGETGRCYGNRQYEHRKEVESISNRTLTWAERKELATETDKLAITNHVAKENHVIDWSSAKILDRESRRNFLEDTTAQRVYLHTQGGQLYEQRWGAYGLTTTYDRILVTCSSATSRDHMPDEVRRWLTKRRN